MKQFKTSGKEEGKNPKTKKKTTKKQNPKTVMKEKRASNEVLKSRVLKKAFKGDKDNTIQSCRWKPTNVVWQNLKKERVVTCVKTMAT